MKRILSAALLLGMIAMPAFAALKPGDKAPDFTAQATLGGKEFTFSLGRRPQEGAGRALFLPQGLHQGLHGRGA